MKYIVMLQGRRHEVEIDGERIVVDGVEHRAELRAVPGTPVRHLTLDGGNAVVAGVWDGPGRWSVLHRGELLDVETVDERTEHIRAMVGAGRAHAGGGTVKAPMPGLVVRILVEAGQSVPVGAGLVVLEAMKMENELKAPAAGVVERIVTREGAAVEKGAVLVELTPAT